MAYQLPQPVFIILHFCFLLTAFYLGTRLNKKLSKGDHSANIATMFIESSLLSLLLGFTFNTAASKSVARKETFTVEINRISTCLARAKLYPDSLQSTITKDIRNYTLVRYAYYEVGDDEDKISKKLAEGDSIAEVLMNKVALYAKDPSNGVYTLQMMPAVNEMTDIANVREMQRQTRVPLASLKMLLLISLLVSFLNGTNTRPDKYYIIGAIGFSLLVSMTLYLIVDLDTTREGFINLDKEQGKLQELIQKFTQ